MRGYQYDEVTGKYTDAQGHTFTENAARAQERWNQAHLPPTTPPRNGLGIAAFVLGITSAVISLIPILGIPGLAAGLVGLGLGLGNVGRLRRREATSRWMTISGMILSALGIILSIAGIVIVQHTLDSIPA